MSPASAMIRGLFKAKIDKLTHIYISSNKYLERREEENVTKKLCCNIAKYCAGFLVGGDIVL